jgi:hypothetical protein
MRIRRFYEQEEQSEQSSGSEQIQLSGETVNEMIEEINAISASFDKNQKILTSLSETLSNFESNSTVKNTNLDDASLNLKGIITQIEQIRTLLESTRNQLKNYYESGEIFIE